MAIKAVFFDIDGTLVDSNEHHVAAWEQAFGDAGFSITAEVIRPQIGKGADMLVPALLPDSDDDLRQRLADAHRDIFRSRYLHDVQAFPGARDLIVRVRQDGKLAVLASSASGEELDHYLGLLDARDLIAATAGGDEVEHTKPAPDIFATALQRVAPIGAAEVIVVGDAPYDIEAAAKCRIVALALRSGGFPDEVLRSSGAAAIYDDAAALLADYDHSLLTR